MHMNDTVKPARQYKDQVFRMLFSDKEHLLELYNALNDTHYDNPEELEITTWEEVIYMSMKNDVSMMIDDYLNLYEHQSTWNPNMPLRGLFYFSDLYKHLTRKKNLYSSKLIPLPMPIYYVFYNGDREMEEQEELRLSDAFSKADEQSCLEVKTRVININDGHSKELMEKCQTLAEYSIFVGKVKAYQKEMELKDAIWYAIEECIAAGVLSELLKTRRDDVMNALMTEYDEERVLKELSEEYYEEGLADGIKKGMADGRSAGRIEGIEVGELRKLTELTCRLKKKGYSPDTIADMLEEDPEVMKHIFSVLEASDGECDPEKICSKIRIDKQK